MKLIKIFLVLFMILSIQNISAQEFTIDKIEPPNWWVGMKHNQIQLMVYGSNLNNITAEFNTDEIEVDKIIPVENSRYIFINISISANIEPAIYKLGLISSGLKKVINYPVLRRKECENKYQGFNNSDVIYLITPDRFCDGDTTNNVLEGFGDKYDRNDFLARHGGDIRGIINKLDYIKNLGITAIWINPLVENKTFISYHGYSATDFYKIDPRFGTNKLYQELVKKAHDKGLKIILDHVSNHFSIDHPWMKNLPMKSWIHGTVKNHLKAEHHKMAYSDIHSDSSTILNLSKGWFADFLPDLNQSNPFVANYIIQNTIWWIESTGLDGIREDTYPYAEQKFLAHWASEIFKEYPHFNIVGEVWTGETLFLASYQKNSFLPGHIETNIPSITDYGLRDVLYNFLKGNASLYRVYELFAKDYVYPVPQNLVTFIDNHDVERMMSAAGENLNKIKIALTILLTTRGIPQIFYGTEIGIAAGEDHGQIRADFPGGFPGDIRNAFTEEGRTAKENELYDYLSKLLSLRNEYPALYKGKMTHFAPENNVYVYFKEVPNEKLMILVNGSTAEKNIELDRYKYQLKGNCIVKNIFTGKKFYSQKNLNLKIEPQSTQLFLILNE